MSFKKIVKEIFIGKAKNPTDRSIFQNISLIALFAWVGLGADGLSSSCYGPEQAFVVIHQYPSLSLWVALAMAVTIFIISESYSQIIELFPTGGGGYLVASKLLSPTVGMVSGCALLIDYVLTIAISIASGADALFSFLSPSVYGFKIYFAVFGIFLLILMNMRGVKESIMPLVPIFMIFIATHFFAILYSFIMHASDFPRLVSMVKTDTHNAYSQIGVIGMVLLILKSYSVGAGTYTGIEAISNGLPVLREPRVKTGRRTMQYMAFSLAFTATGLMIAYLLFSLEPQYGKTLNAGLLENMTKHWSGYSGQMFVLVALISEAALLFVAAQTGFVGGPRVLANMALDRWIPSRFSSLSDRLVTQDGVILMGTAALVIVAVTHGSVNILVVLYSINVFITFCLSQLGMVKHWWKLRREARKWKKKIFINGLGLTLTTSILVSVVFLKFYDGGWVTLVLTGTLVALAVFIKRHYSHTLNLLRRLDSLVQVVSREIEGIVGKDKKEGVFDPQAKTAVLLVNGFNGLGLHTLFNVIRLFGTGFRNFVFIQIGVIDAGNFKGVQEIDNLNERVKKEVERYVSFMKHNGYYAEGFTCLGTDVIAETEKIAADITERFKNSVFFGGQLVFSEETLITRMLHNYTVFTLQRRFYQKGIPFVLVPIRV